MNLKHAATLFLLILSLSSIPNLSAVSDPITMKVVIPDIAWSDLYPLNSFTVKVKLTNQSYVSETNTDKLKVSFEFTCHEHSVRIIDGNCDSSIDERQYYGRISKAVDSPGEGETTSTNFEVTFRDDYEFQPQYWYTLGYEVKVYSCYERELDDDRLVYDKVELLAENYITCQVFGEGYIDYVYTLVKDLDPSSILYTEQLGIPLSVILEEGATADLDKIADIDDMYYAWSYVAPTIDGVIEGDEWSDADHIQLKDTRILIKNDAHNLYLAANITDDYNETDVLRFNFDDEDGGYDDYEDTVQITCANTEDCFMDMHRNHEPHTDVDEGGASNGNGAFIYTPGSPGESGYYLFEMSHPLNSEDDEYDFSLKPGYQFKIQLRYMENDQIKFRWPEDHAMAYVLVAMEPAEPQKTSTELSVAVTPPNPEALETVVVHGHIAPAIQGAQITVSYKINAVTIDTDTVYTLHDGGFESSYVFRESGIWVIRVDYNGDEVHKYSYTEKLVQVYPAEADELSRLLNTTIFLGDLKDTYQTCENIPITGTIAPTIDQASIYILVNGTRICIVETDSEGCFSRDCVLDEAGYYCFRAEFEGDAEYNPSYAEVFMNVTHPMEEPVSYEPSEEPEQDEKPVANNPVVSFTSDPVKTSFATLALLTVGYLVMRRTVFLNKLSLSPSGV